MQVSLAANAMEKVPCGCSLIASLLEVMMTDGRKIGRD